MMPMSLLTALGATRTATHTASHTASHTATHTATHTTTSNLERFVELGPFPPIGR